jgi:hypothetical protein
MAKGPPKPQIPSAHNLEDHPQYVKAIGMVSLETVALELRLAMLMARALHLPLRVAQAIYLTPKSEQTRIEIFKNSAKAAFSVPPSRRNTVLSQQKTAALKDINTIIDRAEKLIRQRHRVIHDEWNYSDKERSVTRKLVDGMPGREKEPIRITQITSLINSIRAVIDDAWTLSESYRLHPPLMINLSKDSTNSG